ncbi:Multidrug export protein MepA [Vibrio aerogenes CECT 7868]|uniref:Multidrug export protein MepA n=1 Tax=Vibrio aerogenes CECT 7868 TaxID=1216006 RepID=A0A1M5Y9Y8_9VIBR|nr:MATE family efflux transporter [Vibrio aerogenes]SHI08792.1 Multidrug export protein MepA [Vibrio aerogenes CECT 7868]
MSSVYTQYFRYTIPTVAAMLISGLYQIVDAIFVGQYLGAAGLAAINIAWPVVGFMTGVGLLVGVGTGAITSVYKGQNDIFSARQTILTGFILLMILAAFLSLLILISITPVLKWQSDDPEVLNQAHQYMSVVMMTSVFSLAGIALPFLIRNDDSPGVATVLMILGAILNICFDYIFIVLFNLSLAGAAMATAISQVAVTVCSIRYFYSSHAKLRLTWSDFSFRWSDSYQIITIGISSLFTYIYWAVMVALHNSQFARYGGTEVLGAYTILGYIVTFYYLVCEGIAHGMQPLASFYYGAKSPHLVRKLLYLALILAVTFGILLTTVLNLYPQSIISLFNDEDYQLAQHAVHGIRMHLFALCLDGILVVTIVFYQSVNQGRKAMLFSLGNLFIQIPFLFLLPLFLNINGVWLAFPLSNIVLTVIIFGILVKDLIYSFR